MVKITVLREHGDIRNCDMAVYSLQYITGLDFGMGANDGKQSLEVRDAAVAKAKAWATEHAKDY